MSPDVNEERMRVLVCGGRDFGDQAMLGHALDTLHKQQDISVIIEGDARGADRMAGHWARKNYIADSKFPADWDKHGKSAGSIRNHQMLEQGKPDLVVAFPGGRGTRHMVSLALGASVDVMRVGWEA